jgi:chromosome segregation ATPase
MVVEILGLGLPLLLAGGLVILLVFMIVIPLLKYLGKVLLGIGKGGLDLLGKSVKNVFSGLVWVVENGLVLLGKSLEFIGKLLLEILQTEQKTESNLISFRDLLLLWQKGKVISKSEIKGAVQEALNNNKKAGSQADNVLNELKRQEQITDAMKARLNDVLVEMKKVQNTTTKESQALGENNKVESATLTVEVERLGREVESMQMEIDGIQRGLVGKEKAVQMYINENKTVTKNISELSAYANMIGDGDEIVVKRDHLRADINNNKNKYNAFRSQLYSLVQGQGEGTQDVIRMRAQMDQELQSLRRNKMELGPIEEMWTNKYAPMVKKVESEINSLTVTLRNNKQLIQKFSTQIETEKVKMNELKAKMVKVKTQWEALKLKLNVMHSKVLDMVKKAPEELAQAAA